MDRKYIKTSDIELAATLFTLGVPIDGIYASEKLTPMGVPIMEFYFLESEATFNLIRQYYNQELRVEPNTLLINRKEMINRLKNEQRRR
jgi:hypothetical protein